MQLALHAPGDFAPAYPFDHSDSGLSPSQHREAVKATDRKRADPLLAWPTLVRLQKAGQREKIAALLQWRALTAPVALGAANDNFVDGGVDGGVHVEKFADQTAAMGEDGEREIRPSVGGMIRAAMDIGPFPPDRVATISTRARAGWTAPRVKAYNRLVRCQYPQHHYFFYGRLLFGPTSGRNPGKPPTFWQSSFSFLGAVKRHNGSWIDRDGRWNLDRPSENWRRDKSAPKPKPAEPPYYLDATVPVLPGADFIAMKPRQFHPAAANDNDAVAEVLRSLEASAVRSAIGSIDAEVLDLATSPMTATEIGKHFGRSGEYARRWAVGAIDRAIEDFRATGVP